MTHTETLTSRRNDAVAKGVATRGIYAERAQNAELWDVDGKRYIDFAAGIAVNNTGHYPYHPSIYPRDPKSGYSSEPYHTSC